MLIRGEPRAPIPRARLGAALLAIAGALLPACREAAAPARLATAPPPVAADRVAGPDAARVAELAARAATIVDAFTNSEPVLTADGARLLFLSDRDGLDALYLADAAAPAAPAVRLTRRAERVQAPTPLPGDRAALFSSDHGADERWAIYRVDLDGSGLVNLTPTGDYERDAPCVPANRPELMLYSARPPAESGTIVYSQSSIAPTHPVAIYRDPLPGGLQDVSADGRWGLFIRVVSRTEITLLVIDLEAGSARPVYPPAGVRATVLSSRFAPDGARVFVSTDGGGEDALVLALDRQTGRELARYAETRAAPARIPQLRVTRRGDRVAANVQSGSRTEVRVLDAATLQEALRPVLPLGEGELGDFSADGRRLTLSWSTPHAPTDAFALDLATGQLARLRQEPRPALDELPPIEASVRTIPAFDGRDIPLNLYRPAPPAGGARARAPVIVSFHGGPASYSPVRWSAAVRFWTALGYAVVEPNIRGSTGFGRAYEMADDGARRMDALRDVATVAAWVGQQPWADPDRRVISGGSYGGYLVLMALTRQPALWRAGIDLYGISDLRTFMASTTGTVRDVLRRELGDPDTDAAFLASISPLPQVDRIAAPLFVYAGANDPRVPRTESDQIVRALRARRVPVEYMVAPDEGHSMDRRSTRIEFLARAARFLEQHLAAR